MIINLVDVNKSFKKHKVLEHINLSVEKGETMAIIGASGSGKSTLLKLMIGLEYPTSGQIWIKNKDINDIRTSCAESRIRDIGLIGTLKCMRFM